MTSILESLGILIETNYWIAPLIALLAGLLTSITPCSLSSIPLVIAYVGGSDSKEPNKALRLSLVFALGSALTFTTLGVIATLLGKMIRFTGDWWYLVLGVLLVLMALQIWEIINIIPSNKLFTKNKKRGFIGAFIAGILAGLFSSPCSTPVLIVLLAIVSAKGSLIYGIILLLLYSIGHSVLAVVVGTSIGFVKKLKGSNKYEKTNNVIKMVFGLLILLLAFYFLYLGF
ncbi:MAG: cytochrome c biogenesis protein CcdA [Bacilli bacterium]|nr:cytochrome c biogenesis protein CcdA [Bacilli bacterium]